MSYFFGVMRHLLHTANKTHWFWCGGILLILALLAVLHHRWKETKKKLWLWRALCLLPLLICLLHEWLYAYALPTIALWFIPMYLIAVFALIPVPFAGRKTGYRISAVLAGLLSLLSGAIFCAISPKRFNHLTESYTDSFHALAEEMDRTYILKEWKEIDFSALEAKYMPAVQEAEREQNPAIFMQAVEDFCCELHDAHVSVIGGYDKKKYQSAHDLLTHEYGLAMIGLDSGEYIAVCTTEDVQALGITDGTVITKWGGKALSQAAAEDVWDRGFPVKANADRLAAIYLSGTGGETVEVSYLDSSGAEQTVTLRDLGKMHTRSEALNAFRSKPDTSTDAAYQAYQEQNFSTKMLNEQCGYLRLQSMTYDGSLLSWTHIKSYLTGERSAVRAIFREKLNDLQAQGMKYLVIDLRNNTGGFDEIGAALCELLTDTDQPAERLGIRKNGQYTAVTVNDLHGTGEFADLQVVALTNYKCASAGDSAALYLSGLPNVTLAGITDPCGIAQGTGGFSVLAECITVEYPTELCLCETDDPLVDPRADRISRNPAEVRIPLDSDAALRIFRDHEDYELDWAVQYLTGQQ